MKFWFIAYSSGRNAAVEIHVKNKRNMWKTLLNEIVRGKNPQVLFSWKWIFPHGHHSVFMVKSPSLKRAWNNWGESTLPVQTPLSFLEVYFIPCEEGQLPQPSVHIHSSWLRSQCPDSCAGWQRSAFLSSLTINRGRVLKFPIATAYNHTCSSEHLNEHIWIHFFSTHKIN